MLGPKSQKIPTAASDGSRIPIIVVSVEDDWLCRDGPSLRCSIKSHGDVNDGIKKIKHKSVAATAPVFFINGERRKFGQQPR